MGQGQETPYGGGRRRERPPPSLSPRSRGLKPTGGPGVFGIPAPHFLADHMIRTGPKTRQIRRDLDGPVRGGEQMEDDGFPQDMRLFPDAEGILKADPKNRLPGSVVYDPFFSVGKGKPGGNQDIQFLFLLPSQPGLQGPNKAAAGYYGALSPAVSVPDKRAKPVRSPGTEGLIGPGRGFRPSPALVLSGPLPGKKTDPFQKP